MIIIRNPRKSYFNFRFLKNIKFFKNLYSIIIIRKPPKPYSNY